MNKIILNLCNGDHNKYRGKVCISSVDQWYKKQKAKDLLELRSQIKAWEMTLDRLIISLDKNCQHDLANVLEAISKEMANATGKVQ